MAPAPDPDQPAQPAQPPRHAAPDALDRALARAMDPSWAEERERAVAAPAGTGLPAPAGSAERPPAEGPPPAGATDAPPRAGGPPPAAGADPAAGSRRAAVGALARKGAPLRRAGLGVVDQGLYSLGNFALTILVARSVSAAGFGAYSIVAVTYLVSIAVIRGLTSETFVVRFSLRPRTAREAATWRLGAAAAAGTSLAASVVASAVVLAIGLASGTTDPDGIGRAALAFAIVLPGLALQDFWRFASLALGRPGFALANDVVVTAFQVAGAGALIATGRTTVVSFVLVWGIGGAVGAVMGAVQLQTVPRPDRVLRWWGDQRDLAGRYVLDDATTQVTQQGSNYVVASIGGLVQSGALRAAMSVFGPPSILNLGVMTGVTPELVRLLRRSPRRFAQAGLLLGAGLGAVGAGWGVVALLLPTSVGRSLFGATWSNVRPLLVFLTIAQVANSVRVAPQASLRALADARRTLHARWMNTVIGLPMTIGAAATGDARWVALAIAVSSPLQAIGWWWLYRRSLADHVARRRAERDQEAGVASGSDVSSGAAAVSSGRAERRRSAGNP